MSLARLGRVLDWVSTFCACFLPAPNDFFFSLFAKLWKFSKTKGKKNKKPLMRMAIFSPWCESGSHFCFSCFLLHNNKRVANDRALTAPRGADQSLSVCLPWADWWADASWRWAFLRFIISHHLQAINAGLPKRTRCHRSWWIRDTPLFLVELPVSYPLKAPPVCYKHGFVHSSAIRIDWLLDSYLPSRNLIKGLKCVFLPRYNST